MTRPFDLGNAGTGKLKYLPADRHHAACAESEFQPGSQMSHSLLSGSRTGACYFCKNTADTAVANRTDKYSFSNLHRTRVVLYAYKNSLIYFVEIPDWLFSELKEQRCVK